MTWPKLSEQLDGPKHPERCQSCGASGEVGINLRRWRECDANDDPTRVVVVLCKRCGDERIERHPRLYAALGGNDPDPGSMQLCVDCRHRDGTTCNHPDLRANGGPGLMMTIPKPIRAHVLRRGKGARCGWETIYPHPTRECAGRVEIEPS